MNDNRQMEGAALHATSATDSGHHQHWQHIDIRERMQIDDMQSLYQGNKPIIVEEEARHSTSSSAENVDSPGRLS